MLTEYSLCLKLTKRGTKHKLIKSLGYKELTFLNEMFLRESDGRELARFEKTTGGFSIGLVEMRNKGSF